MPYFLQDQLTQAQAEALGAFVLANPHCSLSQHPAWVRVAGHGRASHWSYFWEVENGQIQASALVKRVKLPGLGWTSDQVENGPVCADADRLRDALRQLVDMLHARGSVSVRVNPNWCQPDAERVEADLAAMGFHPLPAGYGHYGQTLMVDLVPGEEEILHSFRKATRKQLRKAEELGLSVTPARDEADMRAFWRLYRDMALDRGLEQKSEGFFVRLWHEFLEGERDGHCLIARYQGEVVSGHIAFKQGDWGVAAFSPSAPGAFSEVPKHHLCRWHSIRWARLRGCTRYDLGGYRPDAAPDSPLAANNQFKLGFSKTALKLVREHELHLSPFRQRVIVQIQRWRHKVLTARGSGDGASQRSRELR